MTCSQCRHEFCWLCLGRWDEHGDRTGGYYQCNRYEAAKKRGDYNDDIRKRANAKQALERYTHYFERYNSHLTGKRTVGGIGAQPGFTHRQYLFFCSLRCSHCCYTSANAPPSPAASPT